MKSAFRSHQFNLEELNRNILVRLGEMTMSNQDSKAEFNKELKTYELVVSNMNRRQMIIRVNTLLNKSEVGLLKRKPKQCEHVS